VRNSKLQDFKLSFPSKSQTIKCIENTPGKTNTSKKKDKPKLGAKWKLCEGHLKEEAECEMGGKVEGTLHQAIQV